MHTEETKKKQSLFMQRMWQDKKMRSRLIAKQKQLGYRTYPTDSCKK